MRILGIVVSMVLIGWVIGVLIITPISLPYKVVQKYNGYIVTDKDNLWFINNMTVAKDDSTGSLRVSDLVYQTWAIGDTIR